MDLSIKRRVDKLAVDKLGVDKPSVDKPYQTHLKQLSQSPKDNLKISTMYLK
jgi:hypothetical protein